MCCTKMRLYNAMLNYKNVSKCIMGLRDKVALVYAVIFIIFIAQVTCMPKTKKTLNLLNKCNARPHVESIHKKYKFPDTEYATSFKPRTSYDLDNFDRTFSLKEPSKRSQNLLKQTRSKRKRKPFNNNRRKIENAIDLSPQLPSVPKCDDFPHFPEVEYPLNAREIWKPIYWDDLFPSVDNGQNNIYKHACKKKLKNKNEFDIKNCFKSKTSLNNTKTENNTNDTCSKNMNRIVNTNTPVSNNFIMKDKDSILENDKIETSSATKPISRNMCDLNTKQSDDKQTNNSVPVNNATNTTTVTDICSVDRNDNPILLPNDNDGNKDGDQDIGIDEEFTTDEPDFAFALSTLPPPNTDDMQWKESKIIEPYKSSLYPDELDDYFIAVKN